MTSTKHQHHSVAIHNDCRECRADIERQNIPTIRWHYDHVHDYLTYAALRINAIRQGVDSVDARCWLRDFRKALDRRINLKIETPRWRKMSDGYQERLRGMKHVHDAAYLRRFARVGASALA